MQNYENRSYSPEHGYGPVTNIPGYVRRILENDGPYVKKPSEIYVTRLLQDHLSFFSKLNFVDVLGYVRESFFPDGRISYVFGCVQNGGSEKFFSGLTLLSKATDVQEPVIFVGFEGDADGYRSEVKYFDYALDLGVSYQKKLDSESIYNAIDDISEKSMQIYIAAMFLFEKQGEPAIKNLQMELLKEVIVLLLRNGHKQVNHDTPVSNEQRPRLRRQSPILLSDAEKASGQRNTANPNTPRPPGWTFPRIPGTNNPLGWRQGPPGSPFTPPGQSPTLGPDGVPFKPPFRPPGS